MSLDLDRLRRAIPDDVVALCRTLKDAGHEAWLVGGAVRDLLRDKTGKDFDIATSAHPDEVTRIFGRRRTVPTGAKHGTVTVLMGDLGSHRSVEVTTFRGEGAYSDGRRPDSVAFVSDLVEDLRRRDFTINAIAFDPLEARLADPFGGQADLAARVIRAVGDARERFREDGLRIMRAVRFAAQLEFELDAATEQAIPDAIDTFRKVSQERVRDELLKMLAARRPSLGLWPMQRSGILGAAVPELAEGVGHAQNRWHAYDVWGHTVVAVDETPGDGSAEHAVLRLGTLLHDVAKPRTATPKEDAPGEYGFHNHELVGAELAEDVCRRMKLSNKERERVVALVKHHMFWYSPDWTDATVRRFIGRVGLDLLPDLFALRHGDVCGRGRGEDPSRETAELFRRIQAEVASARALKITDLAIGGTDVMRLLACPPGRVVGDVLKRLLERVLEDPESNTPERLSAMVPEVAAEVRAGAVEPDATKR